MVGWNGGRRVRDDGKFSGLSNLVSGDARYKGREARGGRECVCVCVHTRVHTCTYFRELQGSIWYSVGRAASGTPSRDAGWAAEYRP